MIDDIEDYLDVLDIPPCPRCSSGTYEHDREFRAWVCQACGLWVDDDGEADYI